ncbi:MAG: divalent-cation tolerance protein CutA [Acidobacteriaceae bacterium]|nr:divalent-cation tolerance protein CutA [Acidobacteriaceae bacterium]MBV9500591.1 divalent-cation tolerance protein CutA [Acidobacteriaceae bacterium]
MTDALVIFCTCSTGEEAERIANDLVASRLAACVNILPAIQSIYRWRGEMERANEILLVIKTTQDSFVRVRDRIGQLHTYEVPEIIAIPVAGGSDAYLAWLRAQLT